MVFHFEDSTSRNQNLTFSQANSIVSGSLGGTVEDHCDLRTSSGDYSNLAYILSDQCKWGFRIYSWHYGEIRRTSGCILAQLPVVTETLDCLNARVKFPGHAGFSRKFPKVAIRELLLNAVIHRDYEVDEDVSIVVGYDELWVLSPGPLWEEHGDYLDPRRVPRNPRLSALLEKMGVVFRYRYGSRFIVESYSRTKLSPRFYTSSTQFLSYLPGILDISSAYEEKSRKIRRFLEENPGADSRRISNHVSHSVQYTNKILSRMADEDIVFSMGVGRDRQYYLCDRWGDRRKAKVPYLDHISNKVVGSFVDSGIEAVPPRV